jgi:Tol biopolymer transport system component
MGVGREVAWSPDGAYLLFSARTAESRWDIFTVNVQNNAVTILTQGRDTNDFSPVWTLNGRRVVFLSGTGALAAPARLSVVDPDGNNRQVIDDGEKFYKYISASNDGNIAFAIDDPFGDDFLYRMDLDRKETVKVGPYSVGYVSWSPNGEYLAYGWGTIEILEVATGDIREVAVGHIDGPLVWSSDSRYLAVTGQESIGGFYYAKRILAIDSTNGTVSQLVPYK